MRIAYFSDNFYPEISGISDSIITTGETLRARGHDVVYVVPRYVENMHQAVPRVVAGEEGFTEAFLKSIHRLPSIPLPYSPTGQSRLVLSLGTSIPFLHRFKPDVIHTQSPFGVGLEALLASRILGVPLVGTNHTPIEEFVRYSPLFGTGGIWLARRYYAWYYNRCIKVTAPFDGLLNRMREVGFARPAEALANPVHLGTFRPAADQSDRERIRREYQFKGPVVLYAGRLAAEKKVDLLIEAAARLRSSYPDLTLVITGHGAVEASLRELAKTRAIETQVRFVGFVSHEQLANLYQAADVFTLMSTAETQSLSLMQAFASGVPAVVADAGALPDYTPNECGFVVPPGDIDALVERIKTLLADEGLRSRMGQAAALYVQRFAPETIAGEWEKIYFESASSLSSASSSRLRMERLKK